MEYFAGLDLSLRSCAICVVDIKDKVMLERELPCEIGDIADYPRTLRCSFFEADIDPLPQHY